MRAVFVHIKCALGTAYEVADTAVETIEEISEIYSTSGQYDLLAKFYLTEETDIGRFVTEKVQTLPNVVDTFSLIAFKAFNGQ